LGVTNLNFPTSDFDLLEPLKLQVHKEKLWLPGRF